jgi:hypothetical protein
MSLTIIRDRFAEADIILGTAGKSIRSNYTFSRLAPNLIINTSGSNSEVPIYYQK